jgi:hypothetical protein
MQHDGPGTIRHREPPCSQPGHPSLSRADGVARSRYEVVKRGPSLGRGAPETFEEPRPFDRSGQDPAGNRGTSAPDREGAEQR